MNETRKTNLIRGKEFMESYFSGRVIDIGAGNDLVCERAERFDREDGDANVITQFRPAASYDCVHSSHCLEHMRNPPAALSEWWALVKPGGCMITVVPDEDLYEQGIWPSIFNWDHKATFTLKTEQSWSPVSFNIRKLVESLPDVEIISVELQDTGYDHSLKPKLDKVKKPGNRRTRRRRLVWRLTRVLRRLGAGTALVRRVENLASRVGVPVDQTMREAVAQIQVVARKLPR